MLPPAVNLIKIAAMSTGLYILFFQVRCSKNSLSGKGGYMIKVSLIFFAIAAFGGLTLLALRLKNKTIPMGLAILHGLFAATGLGILIIAALTAAAAVTLPIILFVVAVLGGFLLFSFHVRGRQIPVPFALIHGAVAVVAFVILLRGVI